MLNINYEYRKGIFFLRLMGDLKEKNYLEEESIIRDIISVNKFKYIVLNTSYIESIDIDGIDYLLSLCKLVKENDSKFILCDKKNTFKELFKNIPKIKSELEVL